MRRPLAALAAAALLLLMPNRSPARNDLLDELARLEQAAWNAWRRSDGEHFRSLLRADHVAVNGHGVARREQVVAAIAGADCRVDALVLDEFELRAPSPDVALLVFRVRQTATCAGVREPAELRAASLYVRTEGAWRSLYHQSTPQLEAPATEDKASMEPRISIITLGVEDLERSIAFYRDGLGLPMRESPPGIAFFTLHGTWLSLYTREQLAEDAQVASSGSGFQGFTLAHNVRARDEVDRVIAKARAAGAQLQKPPQDVSWGGYSGYFRDPDGFLWEVAWNPHFWVE